MKHSVDFHYFPGFVRKSLTFSLDDGNVRWDKETAELMRSAGIRGTYNLCSSILSAFDAEGYRAFYDGFEIANHVHGHPFAVTDEHRDYPIVDEPFDSESADESKLYPHPTEDIYYMHLPKGWRLFARYETYLRLVREGYRELEAIFGEGAVKGFVWPFYKQDSDALFEELISDGYTYIRGGGAALDTMGYNLPEDYMRMMYTVNNLGIKTQVPIYEAYPDDGELKIFCIGVHSKDYERDGSFDDLAYFARTFGNQPEKYYTAGVGAILHYASCAKALVIGEDSIENPTDTDIYLTVDGKKAVAYAKCTICLDTLEVISRSV